MNRIILLLLCVLAIAGCEEKRGSRSPQEVIEKMEDDYLKEINRLGIMDLYNEVKWRLYCNYCDVPVQECSGRKIPGLTYGMLDLKVFFLKTEGKKGELAYTFLYNNSIQCSLEGVESGVHGIGFEKESPIPLYYIRAGSNEKISLRCDTLADITGCPTRMINPDQPVVKKFLLANRKKLNPWFHMEAIKRGVISAD